MAAPALSTLVASRAELRAAGATDRQLFTSVRRGRLVAVRRGLLTPAELNGLDAEAAATVRAVGRDVVVSHAHAARDHSGAHPGRLPADTAPP